MKNTYFLMGLLTLVGSSVQIIAQDSVSTTRLNPVNVVVEEESVDQLQSENISSPDAKSYISGKEMNQKQVNHISDVLGTVPGVEFTGGSNPSFKKVSIRGLTGNRVITTVDGAKRTEQTQANMASGIEVEPETVKTVEVYRGADSVANGSGALGGALKFETLSATDFLKKKEDLGGRLKFSTDTALGGQKTSATVYSRVAKDLYLLGQHTRRDADDFKSGKNADGEYQENSQTNNRETSLMKLDYLRTRGERYSLKAEVSKSESVDSSYSEFSNDETTDYTVRYNEFVSKFKKTDFKTPFLSIDSGVFYSQKKATKSVVEPYRGFQSTVGVTTDENIVKGANIENTSLVNIIGGNSLVVKTGVNYLDESLEEQDSFENSFYGNSNGDDLSLKLQNELLLLQDKVTVLAGVRYDRYNRNSDKLAAVVKDKSGSYVSKSFGLSVKPLPYLNVFGKVGDSFRAPNVRELYQGGGAPSSCHWPRKVCSNNPNSELEHEVADSREFGVSVEKRNLLTRGNQLRFKVSYFDEEISDYIQRTPFMYKIVDGSKVAAGPGDATHRDYASQNQSLVARHGVEGEISYKHYGLRVAAGYATMNANCIDCNNMFLAQKEERPLVSAPADKFTASLGYEFSFIPLSMQATGLFVSTQDRLSDVYVRAGYGTEGYQVYGFNAVWNPSFKATGEFELGLAVDNIFNERYKIHNSGTGKEEVGRNFKFSFTKVF